MARCWVCGREGVARGDACGIGPCETVTDGARDEDVTAAHRARKSRRKRPRAMIRQLRDHLARQQGNRCALCGRPFTDDHPPTVDHIVPLSRGGKSTRNNLQAAHGRCNVAKGSMTMREWRERKRNGRPKPPV